jgi:Peptidase family M23
MKRVVILLPVLLALQVGVQPALAWTWPVDGPVLRTFNVVANPYAGGQHRGIDVGAPVGTAVLAPAAGKVSFAGPVAASGPTVTIQTADGLSVTLLQLGTIGVSKGADVSEGAAIGTVGSSRDAEISQSHVHLGIRRTSDPNGYLDPLAFLPARPASPPAPGPEPAEKGEPTPASAPAVKQPSRRSAPKTRPSPAGPAHARPSLKTVSTPRPSHLVRVKGRGLAGERESQGSRGAFRAPRRAQRSFEPLPVRVVTRAASPRPGGSIPIPILFVVIPLAAALAAGLTVLGRQLLDAHAADGAAPVLLEGLVATAEDAHGSRLGQENRLVLDRDLERILLSETEALADLDGDHDPAELVYVADDPRPTHSSGPLGRCLDRWSGGHGLQARRTLGPGSRVSVPARCAF